MYYLADFIKAPTIPKFNPTPNAIKLPSLSPLQKVHQNHQIKLKQAENLKNKLTSEATRRANALKASNQKALEMYKAQNEYNQLLKSGKDLSYLNPAPKVSNFPKFDKPKNMWEAMDQRKAQDAYRKKASLERFNSLSPSEQFRIKQKNLQKTRLKKLKLEAMRAKQEENPMYKAINNLSKLGTIKY